MPQTHRKVYTAQDTHSRELTFAGLETLGPRVVNRFVVGVTTSLEPSTSTNATAEFAGFL